MYSLIYSLNNDSKIFKKYVLDWMTNNPSTTEILVYAFAGLTVLLLVFAVLWLVIAIRQTYRNRKDHEKLINVVSNKLEDIELRSDEPIEVVRVKEYWTCAACGQDFRVRLGEIPSYCPNCGRPISDVASEDEEFVSEHFTCLECGEDIEILDGYTPSVCPMCGAKFPDGDKDDE